MLIDTHCHIQFNTYKDDYHEVIQRCVEKDVVFNTVGTQKETSQKAVEFAEKYDNIYATIGLHPIHLFPTHIDEEESSFVSREEDFDEEYYGGLAKSEKVIAVGECGIDLFHLPKDKIVEEVLTKQKEIFIKQYDFAIKQNLPLVIHIRNGNAEVEISAYEEVAKILEALPLERGEPACRQAGQRGCSSDREPIPPFIPPSQGGIVGVVHCYSSNWQNAKKFLDLGLYLGFTGIVTFPAKKTDPKPQEELIEVIKNCPLDRMLIETDAPYLAPQAYRGQRCEPWMVEEVAKKIAEIKGVSIDEILKITVENAKKLFSKIK
ncbi:MAG: TatD family hydrolase [Candidatus Magasanikbacteria bacterium]